MGWLVVTMSLWEGVFANGVGGKRGWLSILTSPQVTELEQ